MIQDIEEYSNILNVLILLLCINILHFILNEVNANAVIGTENVFGQNQTNLPILSKGSIILYLLILGLISSNLFYKENKNTYLYMYVPLGIILNIMSKPHYWFLSTNNTNINVGQGYSWTTSMVMFLGELLTFGCIPIILTYSSFPKNIPFLTVGYVILSYVLRQMITSIVYKK